MVELEVFDVHVRSRGAGELLDSTMAVVVLREVDGDRLLPIWVGGPEAVCMALELEGEETARPLTHDFAANLLEATSVEVKSVTITKLAKDVFYAAVAVEGGGGGRVVEVDARPSDAINLAPRTKAPIFAEERVMEQASPKAHAIKDGRTGSVALLARLREPRAEAKELRVDDVLRDLGLELVEE